MEVRDVVVTGGTGRLGRRVMSRSDRPGTIKGDLLSGEGIEAAPRAVPPTGRRAMARTSAGSPVPRRGL